MVRRVSDEQHERRHQAFAQSLGIRLSRYRAIAGASAAFTASATADAELRPWRQGGPRNLGGSVRALAQNPLDAAQLYAGSAGGVFVSGDGGQRWRPLGGAGDAFPVGALALAPSNPQVLYVGSGEPSVVHRRAAEASAVLTAHELAVAGAGFLRYDTATGVATIEVGPFSPDSPADGSASGYAAIAVDPDNAERCWIASPSGLWRREPEAPRFRREPVPDDPPPFPRFGAHVSDVVLSQRWNEARPSTYRLFAAVAGVGIYRGVFDPSERSTDWDARLGGGLPEPGSASGASFDRVRLAVCRSFPDHVYAVFASAEDQSVLAVYRSRDAGDHWTACATPAGLGAAAWHQLSVAVHPDDPDAVVVGCARLARSLDGGASWQIVIDAHAAGLDRAQRAGQHALTFDVRASDRLWVASDGGIATTASIRSVGSSSASAWQSRSDGLFITTFHDIGSHPSYPFIQGGGVRGQGSFVGFGGATWLPVGDADGGTIGFEPRDPRRFVAPHPDDAASGLRGAARSQVVAGTAMDPAPGEYPLIQRAALADLATEPHDVFASRISLPDASPPGVGGLFLPPVAHHPSEPDQLLAGAQGDVTFSRDGGVSYERGGAGAFVGESDVSALAYGPGASAAQSDWWIATRSGVLLRGDGGALAKTWTAVTPALPAPGLAGVTFTRVLVHPASAGYVVAATGGDAAGSDPIVQGRVFLSIDRGERWLDITGLGVAHDLSAEAAAAPPGPLAALPPCPIISLAFDPARDPDGAQVLYAGTFAGVYVIRNLPPLPSSPSPDAPAPFNPDWRSFNGTGAARLPLTLVDDLELVTLPPRTGAAADSPESRLRVRLHAAMHGRGVFVSDVSPSYPAGVPAGGPRRRLYLRQHSIEDGLAYPRPTPSVLNAAPSAPSHDQPQLQGDPRLPAIAPPTPLPPGEAPPPAPAAAFDDRSALDIRVSDVPLAPPAAPGSPDALVDAVAFDAELRASPLIPGRVNSIYVQVHDAGWEPHDEPAEVHLFFARGALPASAEAPPLPNLHAGFWQSFDAEPELPPPTAALGAGAARWRRVGSKQVIAPGRVSAAHPAVVRFDWVPPADLHRAHVALLALCTSPNDPLGPQPDRLLEMSTLIREERRAAFRLVEAGAFQPDIYIRDGIDDTGAASDGFFAGRSPDIIVVQEPVADPMLEFADLSDTRDRDRVRHGKDQNIYVRVHNRGDVDVLADVAAYWVQPNLGLVTDDATGPAFDATKWTTVSSLGPTTINVPAHGWAIARIIWPRADVMVPSNQAGVVDAVGLAVLVSATAGARDPAPLTTRVKDAQSFWRFFGAMAESNNAAFRAVLYEGPAVPFVYDPVGQVDDLGAPGTDPHNAWGARITEFYEAVHSDLTPPDGDQADPRLYDRQGRQPLAPTTKLVIPWKAFPMKHLRALRDDRIAAWRAADGQAIAGSEREQDEYCEWFVHRNSAGKITRVDFTSEAFDYWTFLGEQAAAMPDREQSVLVRLYRQHVSSAVQVTDLFDSSGIYDPLNIWNTERGIMHLTQGNNNLNAEVDLVGKATVLFENAPGDPVNDPLQLIRDGGFGAQVRSSDPRIGWDINNLVRAGFAVTLDNPIGLMIDGLDDSGFQKPDGTPAGNYWRVVRGFGGGTVRATYEVPSSEGFVVGDMLVGGRPIEYGAQIAEHVTIKVVGVACRFPGMLDNPIHPTTQPIPATFRALGPAPIAKARLGTSLPRGLRVPR